MQDQQNTKIFRKVDSLPSLPATVSKVLAVTADPESSVEDLVNAVLPDQAMCATILKLANFRIFWHAKRSCNHGQSCICTWLQRSS